MRLIDIAGLARRLEEGQGELNDRLDRIIELLEVFCATSVSPSDASNTLPFRRPQPVSSNGHPVRPA